MILARLAQVFAVLSLLGFGGGRAITPQMYHDAVVQEHWVSAAQFARYFAISKLAPGPTTLTGALIGLAVAGVIGSIVATVALYAPSSTLCYGLGLVWERLRDRPWRDRLAKAMAPIVIGLVWAGAAVLAQGALDVPVTYVIAAGVAATLLLTRVNPVVTILAAGAAGALFLR
jgi:chromate transporter